MRLLPQDGWYAPSKAKYRKETDRVQVVRTNDEKNSTTESAKRLNLSRVRHLRCARLETRIREFNCSASLLLIKREGGKRMTGTLCPWRLSTGVRTRMVVNYACTGRSQGKLWWRSVALLMCKSFVRCGYRCERLIEPPNSWFPPKFPSG